MKYANAKRIRKRGVSEEEELTFRRELYECKNNAEGQRSEEEKLIFCGEEYECKNNAEENVSYIEGLLLTADQSKILS